MREFFQVWCEDVEQHLMFADVSILCNLLTFLVLSSVQKTFSSCSFLSVGESRSFYTCSPLIALKKKKGKQEKAWGHEFSGTGRRIYDSLFYAGVSAVAWITHCNGHNSTEMAHHWRALSSATGDKKILDKPIGDKEVIHKARGSYWGTNETRNRSHKVFWAQKARGKKSDACKWKKKAYAAISLVPGLCGYSPFLFSCVLALALASALPLHLLCWVSFFWTGTCRGRLAGKFPRNFNQSASPLEFSPPGWLAI